MDNDTSEDLAQGTGIYEIRLQGRLASGFSEWFEGFQIELQKVETVLKGEIIDQAELHGLLRRVRDLGIPLVSVKLISVAPNEN